MSPMRQDRAADHPEAAGWAADRAWLIRVGLLIAAWGLVVLVLVPLGIRLLHEGRFPMLPGLLSHRATVPLVQYLDTWWWNAVSVSLPLGALALVAFERRLGGRPALTLMAMTVAAFAYHAATLREGQSLGSDASLYLIHARNIVEGVPYAETGYVINPTRVLHSPATYPPLLPVVLAPVYALRGLDTEALKLVVVAFIALATVAVTLLARSFLPARLGVACGWLVAFAPFVSGQKNDILADIPFAAVASLCLWAAERARGGAAGQHPLAWGVVVGVLGYAAIATRTVGLVLIPVVLLADLVDRKRISGYAITVTAVAVALFACQEVLLTDSRGYAQSAATTRWSQVLPRMGAYAAHWREWWFGGFSPVIGVVGTVALLVLALGGVRAIPRFAGSPMVLFVPAYGAILVTWPGASIDRYALPLLAPLTVLSVLGAHRAAMSPRVRAAVVGLAAVVVASYVKRDMTGRPPPLPTGYDAPEVVGMATLLRDRTTPRDTILSTNPRFLALISRRPGLILDRYLSDERQLAFIDSAGVGYVLANGRNAVDRRYLLPFLARSAGRVERVGAAADYTLFRVIRPPS